MRDINNQSQFKNTEVMTDRSDQSLPYCAALVRKADRTHFLPTLFAPADRRDALFALYAFNHEIAKTREVVSEPMIGQMRLTWWRDHLQSVYDGNPAKHQVIEALHDAIHGFDLSQTYFDTLLDARELDLDDEPFKTLPDLVAYIESVNAPLVYLAMQVLQKDCSPVENAMQMGRQAAIAYGLTGLIRALPYFWAQRRFYLPKDLCRQANVSEAQLHEGRPQDGLAQVIKAMAADAQNALDRLRDVAKQTPQTKILLSAIMPASLAGLSLNVLKKHHFDPTAPQVQLDHPMMLPRLVWAYLRGRP